MIGGLLGQTEKDVAAAETVKNSLRTEMLKKIALGGGWSIGASVVFGAFELLRSDPTDAFPLLRAWGPWAIVTLVALYFGYDVLKTFLNIGTRAVAALEELAIAQQKSAAKDDVAMQEIQTLTAYTSQQSERTWQKLSDHFELTVDLGKKLDAVISQQKGNL